MSTNKILYNHLDHNRNAQAFKNRYLNEFVFIYLVTNWVIMRLKNVWNKKGYGAILYNERQYTYFNSLSMKKTILIGANLINVLLLVVFLVCSENTQIETPSTDNRIGFGHDFNLEQLNDELLTSEYVFNIRWFL